MVINNSQFICIKKLSEQALQNIRIRKGDIILVHSDSSPVLKLGDFNSWADALDLLKECFLNVLGSTGTLIHYVEQSIGVDYRFLKYFKGKVERDGIEWENTIDFYVRYLDREGVSYLTRLGNYLESTGKMNKIILANKYPILLVNANDIYQAILEKLEKDPYYLLKHPPNKLEV